MLTTIRYQLVCSACRAIHADCQTRDSAVFALAVRSRCIDCDEPLFIVSLARSVSRKT